MSTTSQLLMIRPVNFAYNAETAVNNLFQSESPDSDTQDRAIAEFDAFVSLLRENEVDVLVVDDSPEPHTPDSIFPNNWISFHEEGRVFLYPMFAANRRAEKKPHVLEAIREIYDVRELVDLGYFENENKFLEGTGSMVFDRDHRIAYACISPRTDKQVLEEFCKRMNYSPILFNALDTQKEPIYHTNVMMCVAANYVVICLESIASATEKEAVVTAITGSGKKIIPITMHQMNHFAGNMLQLENRRKEKLLVMSTQAYSSLTIEQLQELRRGNKIIHSSLNVIESNGGGSARCMMAEVFLQKSGERSA